MDALFDKRKLIHTPHEYPWNIHGHLNVTFPNGITGRGTATLISKNCLLTAGHCLYDEEEGGLATGVSVFFGRHGDRFIKKVSSEEFIIHPEYLQNDENYDFGVIKLSEDVGSKLGWATVRVFEDDKLKGKTVNVTGYPGTKGVFKILRNAPSYEMYTMEGPIVSVKKHKVYYHIDTSGGQSGSGVWTLGKDGIVECLGVHTTGKSPREEGNGAIRINQENFNAIQDWVLK